MLQLSHQQIENLAYALITVLVLVVAVILLKRYGKLKGDYFGVELNLLTYGFLGETMIATFRKTAYWPHYNDDLIVSKSAVFFLISFGNLVLMGWNFRLADKTDLMEKGRKKTWNKFLIGMVGSVSLTIFLALNTYWE